MTMTVATSSHEESGLKVRRRTTLGTVTVEMAIVAPILAVLLFGIIEFGLIFRELLGLKQGAREGVRAAAVAASTTDICNRIEDSLSGLSTEELQIQLEYRTYSSEWSSWYTLGDMSSGGYVQNDAPTGSQIRVLVTYPHQLATGGLFSHLADEPGGQTITLTAQMTMRRE